MANNPGQPRDTQRRRLYDAEGVLRGLRVSAAAHRHLVDSVRHPDLLVARDGVHYPLYYPSVESVQDYVDAVTATAWFRRRWGFRRLRVTANPGASRGGFGDLHMGAKHRRSEAVILHEIAHNLTSFQYAFHGPEFAAVLLTLVQYQMGAEHASALRAAYTAHRVRYRAGMSQVPKPSEERRHAAAVTASRRGIVPRRRPRAVAAKAAPVTVDTAAPLTYEQSYDSGWRTRAGTEPSGRIVRRPGFSYRAWEDGWLDAAAGRDKYHLRDCPDHDACGQG